MSSLAAVESLGTATAGVCSMSEGLADTSVIIDWDDPTVLAALPDAVAISTITLAELAAGPHLARDPLERARRQARLQQVEALFDPLPFDVIAARSFGQVVAAATAAGRSHRSRLADLLIAAVAHANHLPLYTRNPQDFAGLSPLITVQAI
jgi:predicted nucleic acid-binding protein